MASSTLIFSRWILPFLFSLSLSLSLFLSSIPFQSKPKISGRRKKWKRAKNRDNLFVHPMIDSSTTWIVTHVYDYRDSGILRWLGRIARPVTCCRVARRTLEWAERGRTVSETRKDPIPGKLHACAQSSRGHEGGRRSWLSPSLGSPFLRTWTTGPPYPKDDLLISRLPAEPCLEIFRMKKFPVDFVFFIF